MNDCEELQYWPRQNSQGSAFYLSAVSTIASTSCGCDSVLRHVAGGARVARRSTSTAAFEPSASARRHRAWLRGCGEVASTPSITGMLMSIRTMSGSSSRASSSASARSSRAPDKLDRALAGQDRLERLREQAVIVRDQDANPVIDLGGGGFHRSHLNEHMRS